MNATSWLINDGAGEKTDLILSNTCGYFSILRINGMINAFWRPRRGGHGETHHAISSDGLRFQVKNPIIYNSHMCHNFSIFSDENYKPIGIGGQFRDTGKPHSDGLYMIELHNELTSTGLPKRIVSWGHPGFITSIRRRQTGAIDELDGHTSGVWSAQHKKYYVYVRANVGEQRREVQMASGHSLENLGTFKKIDLGPYSASSGDNYYFGAVSIFEQTFVGLFPFNNNDFACIRFASSKDGIHWRRLVDLLPHIPWIDPHGASRARCQPAVGLIVDGDIGSFYVHTNYFQNDPSQPVTLVRYQFDVKALREVLS